MNAGHGQIRRPQILSIPNVFKEKAKELGFVILHPVWERGAVHALGHFPGKPDITVGVEGGSGQICRRLEKARDKGNKGATSGAVSDARVSSHGKVNGFAVQAESALSLQTAIRANLVQPTSGILPARPSVAASVGVMQVATRAELTQLHVKWAVCEAPNGQAVAIPIKPQWEKLSRRQYNIAHSLRSAMGGELQICGRVEVPKWQEITAASKKNAINIFMAGQSKETKIAPPEAPSIAAAVNGSLVIGLDNFGHERIIRPLNVGGALYNALLQTPEDDDGLARVRLRTGRVNITAAIL